MPNANDYTALRIFVQVCFIVAQCIRRSRVKIKIPPGRDFLSGDDAGAFAVIRVQDIDRLAH